MNIRWLKQNLGTVLFGVVFVAGLGALSWELRKAVAVQKTVEADLAAQQQLFQSLQNKKPFPSQENIQKVKADFEKLQSLNLRLQQHLAQKVIQPPVAQSEIDFAQFLSRTVESLGDQAMGDRAVPKLIVPDNYKFGFSRYANVLPCRDPSIKKEECLELLGKQVVIVQKLTHLMITNGISELVYIRRAEIEPGNNDDALKVARNTDPRGLYTTLPFEIKFASGPDEFQRFANSLTHADWFIAIRSLQVDAQGAATSTTQLTAETEKTRRIAVTMRLDVIEFPQFRPRPNKSNPQVR